MTDAHCHIASGASRHFLCDPMVGEVSSKDVRFRGYHPWYLPDDIAAAMSDLEADLIAHPSYGVGEIGLDRLHDRNISVKMREVFDGQLQIAARLKRPVVLHGAKCWGEVVKAASAYADKIPAFLFHGFSRSGGLVSEMMAMNGFVSVNAALLNNHAVNYRKLVASLPIERVLIESDLVEGAPHVELEAIVAHLAALKKTDVPAMEKILEDNADCFVRALNHA